MATKNRKSEFCRRLSIVVFVALTSATAVRAGDIDPSRYAAFSGDKFYLLSETTFSSDEMPKVRLEVPGAKEALEGYSGVDVRIYRIPQPIDFLKKQKNLHRPLLKGEYAGEGLSNALNYLWDSWYKKSRLAWQRVFSFLARKTAVEHFPELKQAPPHTYQTKFEHNPQFKPIGGLDVVDEYRYPLWQARPIAPPPSVNLAGSSSGFLELKQGNIYIPLGKQKPGLYLVEAMIGTFRASTFLFVSNSVAITKLSSRQELVWVVDKKSGQPESGTHLLFTDGVGVLGEGRSGKDGVFALEGKRLERSYVLGQDKGGGVFVSENFYYDSEIYGNKVYVFTDRPLYRPGDTVNIKLLGREFKSSAESIALTAAVAMVSVVDSEGTIIINKKMQVAANGEGGDIGFALPEFARAGGYSLQVQYKQSNYLSAFRVANYVKPHFEVDVEFAKKDYSINEPIKGQIKLNYPNGDAVKGCQVEVEVRKQKLTIVEGELQYLDRFPIQVSKKQYTANDSGVIDFDAPAAAEPSRYMISARAVDHSSYRVTSTKELLVQTSATPLLLSTEKNFSVPKEKVVFKIAQDSASPSDGGSSLASWEAIRLQDQSKTSGSLKGSQQDFAVEFEKPGSYTLLVKDKDGIILASANHWVQGLELASIPGAISILLDKNEYEPGDTASVLLTFSESVPEALVTFERDQVEKYALLSSPHDWVKFKKISDREFKGEIPIRSDFSPNITLSAAYVANGRYFFENKGIKVAMPKIQIAFHADKETYKPGETVNVSIETKLKGKPVRSSLSVSVVDEAVYALQPEIAPDISDFFFHPRRDQVRTSSSLSFHSYDVAVSSTGAAPSENTRYGERSLKLRERSRREEKDTAFWAPTLRTDEAGRAKFSFVMPDSLTRWRMTGRAIAINGAVGQRKDFIASKKDFYLKWTGPSSYRKGDVAQVSAAVFNLSGQEKSVSFEASGQASGPGIPQTQKMTLHPGANYASFSMKAEKSGEATLSLKDGGKVLDQLTKKIDVHPVDWLSTRSMAMSAGAELPSNAFNLRLSIVTGASEAFFRAVDDLADYPYGCVEQTSSRLLPLALAYSDLQAFGSSRSILEKIQNRIAHERLRLVKMAGPEARFSWWGDQTSESAFMTAYAYYADWVASRDLGIKLPEGHWDHVLEAYKKLGNAEPLINKVLILWLASEMNLPIKTLTEGLIADAANATTKSDSALFEQDRLGEDDATSILLEVVSRKAGVPLPSKLASRSVEAKKQALGSKSALAISVYLLAKEGSGISAEDKALAEQTLQSLAIETPTIDRGLSLAFLHRVLRGALKHASQPASLNLGADWVKSESRLGRTIWQFRGSVIPKRLPENWDQSGSSLHLAYDSYAKEQSALPVVIERQLSKLVQKADPLEFEMSSPLSGKWDVNMKDVYVDEVTLKPQGNGPLRFGLLEVALPPGAEAGQSTWGMTVKLSNGGDSVQLEYSSFQAGEGSYSIAVENLTRPRTFRNLIRFSQSGDFEIPPARFFRMYFPAQKAFEGGSSSASKKISVR